MKSALWVLLNREVTQIRVQSKARFVCTAVSVCLKLLALYVADIKQRRNPRTISDGFASCYCSILCRPFMQSSAAELPTYWGVMYERMTGQVVRTVKCPYCQMVERLWYVVLRHVTPCSLVTGTKFRRNVSTRLHGVTSRNTVNAVTIAARTWSVKCRAVATQTAVDTLYRQHLSS